MIIPTPEAIHSYWKNWEAGKNVENYKLQEGALEFIFHDSWPANTDLKLILIKVTALNQFYSTNIYDVNSMAKHICQLNIDDRLAQGDLSLVNEMASITIKGKKMNFYSFASKYCSHHFPEVFPIYDSFVERMLVNYAKQDDFASFKRIELKVYPRFVEVIKAFQKFYGLEGFSLKQIDIFLWLVGKELFSTWSQRNTASKPVQV